MRFVLPLALALVVNACVGPPDRIPVPEDSQMLASIAGYGPIRAWGDEEPDTAEQSLTLILAQAAAAGRHMGPARSRVANLLAISGGGSDGAYGAGLLIGWTKAEDRPEFDVVTGISTGALTAPFAFLGSDYDQVLRAIYTSYGDDDIYSQNRLFGIFANAAIFDTEGLKSLIARYVDDEVVNAIAREHKRGRRLLIGTAHLDAQRSVLWNIGAIAASGQPDRIDLIHNILTASAAIPGVFPAVRIQVTIDGETYDELHVDGGTTEQVILFPRTRPLRRSGPLPDGAATRFNLYIIRNGKLTPEWKAVDPSLPDVAGRSISTMIKRQAIGDLNRLYLRAERLGMNYYLASIPADFKVESESDFDTNYMRALLERGEQDAINGYPWRSEPPNL